MRGAWPLTNTTGPTLPNLQGPKAPSNRNRTKSLVQDNLLHTGKGIIPDLASGPVRRLVTGKPYHKLGFTRDSFTQDRVDISTLQADPSASLAQFSARGNALHLGNPSNKQCQWLLPCKNNTSCWVRKCPCSFFWVCLLVAPHLCLALCKQDRPAGLYLISSSQALCWWPIFCAMFWGKFSFLALWLRPPQTAQVMKVDISLPHRAVLRAWGERRL